MAITLCFPKCSCRKIQLFVPEDLTLPGFFGHSQTSCPRYLQVMEHEWYERLWSLEGSLGHCPLLGLERGLFFKSLDEHDLTMQRKKKKSSTSWSSKSTKTHVFTRVSMFSTIHEALYPLIIWHSNEKWPWPWQTNHLKLVIVSPCELSKKGGWRHSIVDRGGARSGTSKEWSPKL